MRCQWQLIWLPISTHTHTRFWPYPIISLSRSRISSVLSLHCCLSVHWVGLLFTALHTDAYVVKPMGDGTCIMGNGSVFVWVNGYDPLPALGRMQLPYTIIIYSTPSALFQIFQGVIHFMQAQVGTEAHNFGCKNFFMMTQVHNNVTHKVKTTTNWTTSRWPSQLCCAHFILHCVSKKPGTQYYASQPVL